MPCHIKSLVYITLRELYLLLLLYDGTGTDGNGSSRGKS